MTTPNDGILTIHLTSSDQQVTITHGLPKQSLRFVSSYCEFTSSTVANAQGHILVEIPFIASGSVLSNIPGHSGVCVPITNDTAQFTLQDKYFMMNRDMPSSFRVRLKNLDGSPIASGLLFLTLQFQYHYTHSR